ncbi:MAG: 5-(carboxyamino)imidazole ribonucleotide synthase [Rhodocyclaceae bacterium]|nr:5-(carboxyamino)imidazole ribonucleotide synthase [Rhodocyclaceae bacterium]MCA3023815.1 5-(carboxyamino)imidazole ribonucleotide synthase [Rhodocyclaceae bacterium]MCA3030648.1 5-(carboxyamino)imidazole ribonucleotide synthase [Rhodocyclaceae bacterium]MCA3035802.1 5-(carboxyamino)imidazole ribonucleotide synthase [Rhodocyclaceae bacterium]MCA3044532.1 5-(carboxyamino)imidazole ribonucleotide synthase [Rhodocyclaceae bacterium]
MILPGATLGLIGGGQLGRMFTMAARNLDYRVTVLDPDPLSPAAEFATGHLNTAYTHPVSIEELANSCAAVTTEFENAPAEVLLQLASRTTVRPSGNAVGIAQDRELEKGFFKTNGFPVGAFAVIKTPEDIDAALTIVTLPAVLKTARFGYDGKGQARIESRAQLVEVLDKWRYPPTIFEQWVPLKLEISVVLARTASGEISVFPVVENQHVNGILDITIAPARISPALADAATSIANAVAVRLAYVGVLAVEFFVLADNTLLINEIAPRPHNSGHFTIDACRTSQFEQQVRVLCDLPLGDATQHSPAVMLNLLGDLWRGKDHEIAPDWSVVLSHPGAHLHLYGKRTARPGRKMGHVTVCDVTAEAALAAAMAMKSALNAAA